jgi:hypothetical protein
MQPHHNPNHRVALIANHAKENSDIMGIMGRMEHEFMDTEADAKHEFSSIKDDIKNKNLEEKHSLRIQLEGTVEELWRQFQQALNQYTTATEERKKQFEELKHKVGVGAPSPLTRFPLPSLPC